MLTYDPRDDLPIDEDAPTPEQDRACRDRAKMIAARLREFTVELIRESCPSLPPASAQWIAAQAAGIAEQELHEGLLEKT